MSLPVLAGFAGVLVAAVATGMLAGRCVRQPRAGVTLWAVATLGLTVALAAQSMGFDSGFGPATFRAVQLCALLLAPLSLAWGLVEMVAQSEAVRFGMRLVSGALIAVAAVILTTEPLTAQPFSKSWPSTDAHSQPFSHYALDLAQGVAVVAVAMSAALVLAYARNDPRWRSALPAMALVGLAVLMTVALRFSLPGRSAYPLLSLMAAALVWLGMTRFKDVPGRAVQVKRASGNRGRGEADGRRDIRPEPGDGYWPDDGSAADGVPADGVPADRYATYGQPRPSGLGARQAFAAFPEPGRPGPGRPGPGRPASPGPDAAAMAGTAPGSGPAASGHGSAPPGPAAAAARPYGRILIFTVLEDRVADFDRLAEQTAEEVRTAEPDTLVYVIHLVPNAPLQRIFYEVYRDRAAFERHENQPYMKRFVVDRRACVLATNVIELRLKYAKVAPLPAPAPAPPAGPPPPAGMRAPQIPELPQGSRRLHPLPSAGRRYGGG